MVEDTYARPLRDLRISVTDRCNFRCVYCMPQEVFGRDFQFLKRDQLLSFEEIERLARIFVQLGVQKIRITGGEPLVRRDVDRLILKLASLDSVDLTMTTNGVLLPKMAGALAQAGLKRLTISLDALEDEVFKAMNDVEVGVEQVLDGLRAAEAAGFHPIKINMVVKRGINTQSILPMARYFRNSGHILRFIEFMDVGQTNGWKMDQVISAREILERIQKEFPIEPLEANYPGEVARRWRYQDGAGEIGVIASVTQPFCRGCTRIRLSADGILYTCLFAASGHDVRTPLRDSTSDAEIRESIHSLWRRRTDRYSEIRSSETSGLGKVEMSYIGG